MALLRKMNMNECRGRLFAFQAFTGLGFAVILTLFFHSVCDLGVITWSAQATYLLFGQLQEIPDNFFYSKYGSSRKI